MAFTSMPASSRTSRRTASSIDSPWSMNPASAENIPAGQLACRPSKHRRPSLTTVITTGSVLGKCSAEHSTHLREMPPWTGALRAPQTAQWRLRECQSISERAWAAIPASSASSVTEASRRSANAAPSGRSSATDGSAAPETLIAKRAAPLSSSTPSSTGKLSGSASSRSLTGAQANRSVPASSTIGTVSRYNGSRRVESSARRLRIQSSSRRCAATRSSGLPAKVLRCSGIE